MVSVVSVTLKTGWSAGKQPLGRRPPDPRRGSVGAGWWERAFFWVCQAPRGAVTKCHKLGGLKRQKFIVSWFWRLAV